jgi:aspartate aminotransferase
MASQKSFAMTGWRLGYLAGPKNIADACAKVQSQFTSGANATAQRAALAALEVGKAGVQSMVAEFKKRRDYLMGLMKEVPGIKFNKPDGAFYLFPEVKSFYGKKYKDRVINNSKDLCMYLLEEAHVGLTPGFAFGAPDNIRLSYAVKEDTLKKAVERIKKALGELK